MKESNGDMKRQPEETVAANDTHSQTVVIPVIEEQFIVSKRQVETGRTRVSKRVNRVKSVVDEPLVKKNYDVKRVPVNRVVEAPAGPRQEGETLILPVYEERVFVEKRLVLVEELHVTRNIDEIHDPHEFELLQEIVTVERTGGEHRRE
jgi:uncharacterized protein (TIGR02271 family)